MHKKIVAALILALAIPALLFAAKQAKEKDADAAQEALIGYEQSNQKFESDARSAQDQVTEKMRRLKLDGKSAFLLHDNGGLKSLLDGDNKAAIESFTRAVKARPDYMEGYEHLALAKVRSEDYEGAVQDYTKAIELAPEMAYFNTAERGGAYLGLGRYDLALKDFDKALEKKPNDPRYLRHKSMALVHLGNYAEAAECYQRAVSLDPQLKGKDKILCGTFKEHNLEVKGCG